MARNISVKVSTAKVIKALEDKLASAQKAVVSNEKKRKDYEKVEKAYAKQVADLAIKQIAKAQVSADKNWRDEVYVRFEFPANTISIPEKPQLELEQELSRYEVVEIENAIRILKMTDEEVVNASTFNKVAQYL